MNRIITAVIISTLCFTGCSTLRPHVNQYRSDGHWFSCDRRDIKTDAKKRADYLRCEYTDVINDRVTWDRGSGMAIAGALGVAAYKGIRGGNSSQIASLTVGSAALYGANLLLANDKVSAVYAAGIEAISCVEKKYSRQFGLKTSSTTKRHNDWLLKRTNEFDAHLDTTKEKPVICPDEKKTIEDIRHLKAEYDLFFDELEIVDRKVISELDQVDAKVKGEVNKLLPDIESIYQTAASSLASFPAPKDPPQNNGKNEKKVNEACDPVIVKPEDDSKHKEANDWLRLQIAKLSSDEGNEVACNLTVVKTLMIGDGQGKTYEVKKGQTIRLPILYATGALTPWTSNSTYVEATTEYDAQIGYLLSIKATNAAPKNTDTYYVYVTDHGQNVSRQVAVRVVP